MFNNLREIKDTNEFNYAVNKIYEWYKNGDVSLNIITVPYNSTLIFKDIILRLVRENKRVLYIWNGVGEKKKLVGNLKNTYVNINSEYITKGKSTSEVVFINYKNIDKVEGKYDLIIYDDISFYSSVNNEEIKNSYNKILQKTNKVIIYSIEGISVENEFYLSPLATEKPFVEPRIINTRIDLNTDIPYILYDYLKWFRDKKKRVLLLTPKEKNTEYVYEYYVNKLKMKDIEVVKAVKDNLENIKIDVLERSNKSIFIVTNDMEVILENFIVDDAVILFSDNEYFSYKKFLYICAYIGKLNRDMPEVLLVSRDTSLDMDTAKDISRNFNKLIWKKKLKKV